MGNADRLITLFGFQFLIGRLGTSPIEVLKGTSELFQFLIGRLGTLA